MGKWPGGTKALTMYHEGGGGGGGRIEKKRKMHLGRRLLLSFLAVLRDACGGFERKKKEGGEGDVSPPLLWIFMVLAV